MVVSITTTQQLSRLLLPHSHIQRTIARRKLRTFHLNHQKQRCGSSGKTAQFRGKNGPRSLKNAKSRAHLAFRNAVRFLIETRPNLFSARIIILTILQGFGAARIFVRDAPRGSARRRIPLRGNRRKPTQPIALFDRRVSALPIQANSVPAAGRFADDQTGLTTAVKTCRVPCRHPCHPSSRPPCRRHPSFHPPCRHPCHPSSRLPSFRHPSCHRASWSEWG